MRVSYLCEVTRDNLNCGTFCEDIKPPSRMIHIIRRQDLITPAILLRSVHIS